MGKIGIAYPAFFSAFKARFPDLEVVDLSKNKVEEYKLIIFSGGEDINPSLYAEDNRYSYFNTERDEIEKSIFRSIYGRQVKILGICRGHQLINVLLGGRLAQDIQFDLGEKHSGQHKLEWSYDPSEDSRLSKILDVVNSMHHQAVTRIGSGLNICAKHGKAIEVSCSQDVLTVQCHPEWLESSKSIAFFDYVKDWIKEAPKQKKITTVSGKKLNYTTIPESVYSVSSPEAFATPQPQPTQDLIALEEYLHRMEQERRSR